MAFKHENIGDNEQEQAFFRSLKVKDWAKRDIPSKREWFADRENNAFLIGTGSRPDLPQTYTLWWKGENILVFADDWDTRGNGTDGLDVVWNIQDIRIPSPLWEKRAFVVELVRNAFTAKNKWGKEYLNSMQVNFKCEPKIMEDGKL